MAKSVVYTPVSLDPISNINAPKEIDKPDYPDKGISYAGYSKTLISGNQYQLNPQEQKDFTFSNRWNAGDKTANCERESRYTKDFYCTKIILCELNTAALWASTSKISICDGNSIRVMIIEPNQSGIPWNLSIDFDIPLKFTKGNTIKLIHSVGRAAGDEWVLNLYGWEE